MVVKFLKEALYRLRAKSPRFFYVLQIFGACLTFASYLPGMLERWTTMEISPQFINFCEDIAKYAAGFTAAVLLPAEASPTSITQNGNLEKQVVDERYPFTAESQLKQAEKDHERTHTS